MKNKYLVLAVLTVAFRSLFSQQITFSTDYNLAPIDIVGNVVQNPSKNYVMAGSNVTLGLYGNVTQLDTIGNIMWSKGYSGGSIETDIWDIKNVSSGGYIFTGSTGGSGLMLVRIDNSGNVTWSYKYHIGSGTDEHGSRVIETSDGGFAVAGYVYGATPPASTVQDSANLFCLKVDAGGNLQWGRVFFVSKTFVNDHVLNDVAEVSDGYVFTGYASVDAVDADGTNAIVLKTSKTGVLQWLKKFGSSSAEGNSIVQTATNEVMVSGDDNSRTYYARFNTVGSGSFTAGNQYNFGLLNVSVPYSGFTTYDGNYAFMGQYIGFPFTIAAYLLKVNASTGNVIFSKGYRESSSLSLILPEGSQAVDSGFVAAMTAQQGTGFNYHVVKCDRNGLMNSSSCDTLIVSNPTKSSYTATLTSISPDSVTSITGNSFSVVVANLSPTQVVNCINVPCTPPATPTASAASTTICSGQSTTINGTGSGTVTYNVYNAPTGGTLLGTAPLSVSPTTTTTYYVEANSSVGCNSTSRGSVTVTVNQPPSATGSITGVTNPCPGSQNYFIGTVSSAATYTWSVSGGGTITAGQGTTQITVNWTTSGGPYTVSVVASNTCGQTSNTTSVTVQTGPPAAVGAISGNTAPCPAVENYSVSTVANATTYTWSVSGGGTISTGQGTNQISINWTSTGGPYTVSVVASNACGSTSNSVQVNVQNGPPSAVGTITGNANPCPGSENYSISSVSGASTYTWAVSAGGTITAGQGSTQITVNWTAAGGPYTVSVTANNACGSTSNSIPVTVQNGAPASVGNISGSTSTCVDTVSYSIASVANATSYVWSVSGGGAIQSGQGTTQILVDWTTAGGPYTVSVVASNSCGSASGSVNVTVNPAPSNVGAAANPNPVCAGLTLNLQGSGNDVAGWSWSGPGGYSSLNQNQVINSASLSDSGAYTLTATNSCGTITATVNVVVNTSPTGVTASATPNPACAGSTVNLNGSGSGATSWSWTGPNSYTSAQLNPVLNNFQSANAGSYTLTATNACGSTSATFSLNLQPIPSGLSATANLTDICGGASLSLNGNATGATSFSWTGPNGFSSNTQNPSIAVVTLADSGTYVFTATNICGSDSTTILVDVDTLIENVTVSAAPNDTVCVGSTLNLSAGGSNVNTWNWTGPNSFASNQQNPSVSPLALSNTGNYIVTASNACGTVRDTVNVLVLDVPAKPGAIIGTASTCGGDTINYSISSVPYATSYTWTLSGGGTILSGQGSTSINVGWSSSSGTYTLSVTAGNNCGTSVATTLDVTVLPPAPVMTSSISGDTGVCPGIATYSVTNIPNATGYTWSVSSGGAIASGQGTNSATINWSTSGVQTVSVVATNQCGSSSAATLQVNVHPSPTAPTVDVQGDTICQGSSTVINATNSTGGIISYNFYDAATGGNLVGTSPLTVTPNVTTVYYLEVTNQYGCTNSGGRIPVTVYVIQAPAVLNVSGANDTVCFLSTTVLTATVSPANASVTWWDSPVAGSQVGSGATYTAGPLTQSTIYYAQAEVTGGCNSLGGRVAVPITVTPLPVVTLTSNKDHNIIFQDDVLTFTALPDGYSNYEFFVNGTSVQSGPLNTYSSSKFNDLDSVSVIATDNGCNSVEAHGIVHVVDFPNAFTPNHDGVNDVFLKDYDLVVLNRWGQELYKGTDGWDGTYKGSKVAPGTYYYIVTLNNITDRKTTVKGTVLLIQD